MFAGQRKGLAFQLRDGQQVVASGNVDVYERDGKYQLYAREIALDGAGDSVSYTHLAGAALMILGTPVKKEGDLGSLYESGDKDNAGIDLRDGEQAAEEAGGKAVHASADGSGLYEAQMEERIRSILKLSLIHI